MASNQYQNEKPNLRPTKRVNAGGKTIFLHHNPHNPSTKSYIRATYRNAPENSSDPFGIERGDVEYSLNKRQRWEVLNDFRRHLANEASSSNDELDVQSDSEQPQRKNKSRRKKPINPSRTKYRLITSNVGQRRTQLPNKTYMQDSSLVKRHGLIVEKENAVAANNNNSPRADKPAADVTYFAVVPPPREKQLSNIRIQHGYKAKKTTNSTTQRSKVPQTKGHIRIDEPNEDGDEEFSSDADEPVTPSVSSQKPIGLQLTDFIRTVPDDENLVTKVVADNLVTVQNFDPKSSRFYLDDIEPGRKFRRQISREEKLYNHDKAVYLKRQKSTGKNVEPKQKPHHYLMPLSFRTILMHKMDLNDDLLSKAYNKNFIHAQCYPTKYLICITDRLKAYHWANDFELFPTYATLNAYLIFIPNLEDSTNDQYCRVQVGLNMDLYADSIQLENLYESSESIYTVDDVVQKAVEFVTSLPFEAFKPIDSEISRRRLIRNEEDNDLSESEFVNKQIRHLQLLDKSSVQAKTVLQEEELNSEISADEYDLIRPNICTNCYQDIDETTPMTALKSCAHWLCNECWRQYLENSVKGVKVVLCPEWNCCSIIDVGTLLSLINVRCMNLYERNIEKCLVNVSRSYTKCPSKSCSNIIQVIGSNAEHVRCRCGHEFCLHCRKDPHFPATCSAYRLYIDEVYRNGDFISDYNAITQVKGRNCISCDNFIEKNGGCNHMTCRCGTEFCWTCIAYWKDHYPPDGTFRCPKEAVPLQEEVLAKHHNQSRRYYYAAILHHHERLLTNTQKQNENVKRLLGTIPLDKGTLFDSALVKSQVDKREAVLRHLYQTVKYIANLHRICEFIAVAAEGYGNNPSEFRNSLQPLETVAFQMSQILEGGRGPKAVEQLKDLYASSEKIIERLRRAVTLRELRRANTTGYVTS
ncbi:unnamed protein product [Adineta ricciae]|uniref:RBR-type E3 ubiquitin transferase n=1 Tax=Adineta ricciae TaxID=249248 RepID=A0A813XCL1_ADIRI|nr:unnamed protein product [Adineta ricciae]